MTDFVVLVVTNSINNIVIESTTMNDHVSYLQSPHIQDSGMFQIMPKSKTADTELPKDWIAINPLCTTGMV